MSDVEERKPEPAKAALSFAVILLSAFVVTNLTFVGLVWMAGADVDLFELLDRYERHAATAAGWVLAFGAGHATARKKE